jgi:hypothetical protein
MRFETEIIHYNAKCNECDNYLLVNEVSYETFFKELKAQKWYFDFDETNVTICPKCLKDYILSCVKNGHPINEDKRKHLDNFTFFWDDYMVKES